MQSHGIDIDLPNINTSGYTFLPDVSTNTITYGIKGITRISDSLVEQIIEGRPYTSLSDFLSRVKVNKLQATNLIKSGAFDKLEGKPRVAIMDYYLYSIADTKSRLTLANMPLLIRENLLPEEVDFYKRLFNYNRYLKTQKQDIWYVLDHNALEFYSRYYTMDEIKDNGGTTVILQRTWDNLYKKEMEPMRVYLKEHMPALLTKVNFNAAKELFNKYATGSVSKWEMASLGFYFGPHELTGINKAKYNVQNFFNLSENPEVARIVVTKTGARVPLYHLHRLAGTVINKERMKNTVVLLTENGVVNVKVWAAQFTKYDKQISERQANGKKKIMERSWFTRGNKILVTGIRRGDIFIPKVYSRGAYQHPFILINNVEPNGDLVLQYTRYDDYDRIN